MNSDRTHPFVMALNTMFSSYGGQWPPRGSFEDWPKSFSIYQEIADEMPKKLAEFNNVQKFRSWLRLELDKVNLREVMQHIDDHLAHDDPILLGFAAPLAILANAYRWGTAPITEAEVRRTYLEFPENLWTPFEKINDFHGLVHRGSVFTICVCNCIYEDDVPVDMRFHFNADNHKVKTEKNFFLSLINMEKTWESALQKMADYLTLTENARESHDTAEQLLGQRVQLLTGIRKTLVVVSRVFHKYMNDSMVLPLHWSQYVQCVLAWNINGITGGASGGEFMTFHSLDEFLGTLGDGVVYRGALTKRSGAPLLYRNCLEALADDSRSYRFDSFLDLPKDSDPLQKAKDDLISMVYTWRLHHTKVAQRYMKNSIVTAAGHIDRVKNEGETLAMRGQKELRERARETVEYMSKDRKPNLKCSQVTSNISLKSMCSLAKTTCFIFSVLLVCTSAFCVNNLISIY